MIFLDFTRILWYNTKWSILSGAARRGGSKDVQGGYH